MVFDLEEGSEVKLSHFIWMIGKWFESYCALSTCLPHKIQYIAQDNIKTLFKYLLFLIEHMIIELEHYKSNQSSWLEAGAHWNIITN